MTSKETLQILNKATQKAQQETMKKGVPVFYAENGKMSAHFEEKPENNTQRILLWEKFLRIQVLPKVREGIKPNSTLAAIALIDLFEELYLLVLEMMQIEISDLERALDITNCARILLNEMQSITKDKIQNKSDEHIEENVKPIFEVVQGQFIHILFKAFLLIPV